MNCSKCGKEIDLRDRFCSRCGTKIPQSLSDLTTTGIPVDDLNSTQTDYSNIKLHILLLRALAFIIDFGAYVSVMLALVLYVIGPDAVKYFEKASESDPLGMVQGYFVIFGMFIIYNAVLESTAVRGSIGKLLVGIKVTSTRGLTMKFLFSIARNFLKLLPILLFPYSPYGTVIGSVLFLLFYLYPFFTTQALTIPDLICGCLIISRKDRRKKREAI